MLNIPRSSFTNVARTAPARPQNADLRGNPTHRMAPDAAPRGRALLLRAEPREKREFDPVIGKAIAEKGGFFVAAIVLSVVFEKASQYLAAQ